MENKETAWWHDVGIGYSLLLLSLFMMANSISCDTRSIREDIKAMRVEMEKRK